MNNSSTNSPYLHLPLTALDLSLVTEDRFVIDGISVPQTHATIALRPVDNDHAE